MSARRARRQANTSPTITASEIGEYAYCSRAWWYRHVVKLPIPEGEGQSRLHSGAQRHREHGAWVASSTQLRIVGIALAVCGVVALVLALLVK
jgi:CRISPR/Cas system-associated exonuclease Cas4 (RecB family)